MFTSMMHHASYMLFTVLYILN